MSDLPMKVPRKVGREGARAELVLYVDDPTEEYAALLRAIAHMAHDLPTWFSYGHTLAFSDSAEPLFPGSELTGFLLMVPVVQPDYWLRDELEIEGDPVNLLWVVPLTAAEMQLKLERGFEALMDVFERSAHRVVLDVNRRSYV
jgi:hypothetical protein